MLQKKEHLKPRKKPLQERSAHTVNVIFEATIQVLLAGGAERLTTSKVAERAGVSVGTLYQYFGNKQSLLSAVLEKHLLEVCDAVTKACVDNHGKSLEESVFALVKVFFDAKFSYPEASKALYAIASDLDASVMVETLMKRSQVSICELLSSVGDARFEDVITASFVISTTLVGPVQALLSMDAPIEYQEKIHLQLSKMTVLYLTDLSSEC